MTQILKRSSFSLVRTNPRLTTNVKIVNSNNRVYLDSIDADSILTRSMYKKYDVTGGNYSFDLHKFFNQGGELPLNLAYKVFEKFSHESIKSSFSEQYDFEYCSGAYTKTSALYDEEFAYFAPLWVEKDNIPEYFIILKLDGPVTKNSNGVDDLTQLNSDVTDPNNFFDNYIKGSKLVKAISLEEDTHIGKYIRDHVKDESFPDGSIYATVKKNELSYVNGISYKRGGFCSIADDIYTDIVLKDKTILEKDNIITNKFSALGVVQSNILNLEFLFDDSDEYKFNRYMGFYVSEAQLTQFKLEESFKKSGTNSNSIKVKEFFNDATNISLSNFQNRMPYVKDVYDNLYLVDQEKIFESRYETDSFGEKIIPDTIIPLEIITKNDYVNSRLFTKLTPNRTINVLKTSELGRSSLVFKVTGIVTEDTQIRIDKTHLAKDNSDLDFDYFGVRGNSQIGAGLSEYNTFSNLGNSNDIAKAIASAINNIESFIGEQIFSAISQNDLVIIYVKIQTKFWDNLKCSIFSTAEEFPFTILNQNETIQNENEYILTFSSIVDDLPAIDETLYLSGKLVQTTFKGGSDNAQNRLIIDINRVNDFYSNEVLDQLYVKNGETYSTVESISTYLDEPSYDDNGNVSKFNNIEKWAVCLLSDTSEVSYNGKIVLYSEVFPSFGYFSFFPIKDFDFDIYNQDYSKCEDSKISQLWNYLRDSELGSYDYEFLDEQTNFNKLNSLTGIFSNEFLSSKGFIKLSEVNLNEEYDTLKEYAQTSESTLPLVNPISVNEYDRLNEKWLTSFATFSKTVPFVNKWVADDLSSDVRNNNYRLNVDQTFGHLNFSPSFEYFNRDPRHFTHEWYLLQKYPPYFSEDDKINSYSYFESNINENSLKSMTADYFTSYFTRRFVGSNPIKTDYKYSIFSGGNTQKFAECIFRGVKVRVKKRLESSEINYNLKDKKFIYDKTYNDWKFSSVLALNETDELGTSIKFIKNNKFKNITCLIKSDLRGEIQNDFIDRTLLYTLNHKTILKTDLNSHITTIKYDNKAIQGQIYKAVRNQNGSITVTAKNLLNSGFPNFKNEILNISGTYNNIIFDSNGVKITFSGITKIVDSNTFICSAITFTKSGNDYLVTTFSLENNILDDSAFLDIPGLNNLSEMQLFVSCIKSPMLYESGGYNGYLPTIKDITFANIANLINVGDPKIQYIEIDELGNESTGKFIIELVKPDYELTSSYLESSPILPNKDIDELNSFNIFGYNLAFKERTSIKPTFRNRFYFNPKVYDVVNFCDDSQLEQLVLKNTKFYLRGEIFNIKNLFFNKVNTNNNNILKLTGTNQYPLIEQCTLSKKDFNIFKSNWDTNYYNEFVTEKKFNEILGALEQFEQRSFMGSKLLTMPNEIEISNISEDPINNALINIDNLNSTNVGIFFVDNGSNLKINILTDILLQNYLLGQIDFTKQFSNYIDPSLLNHISLEDYMREYISLNIKERYIIKDIILWKKSISFLNKSENLFKLNLTSSEKESQSFSQVTNFTTEKINAFNSVITYNKKMDETEQFSLTIKLKKI